MGRRNTGRAVQSYPACLLYQCYEGKVHESRLYDELNRAAGELAQRIVQDLPEYDKASWGD